MTKGFFRERRHYQLFEIAEELRVPMEEAVHLTGILKKYGIVKAVKKSRAEYGDLSDQDVVLADVSKDHTDIDYIFDFVGVVMAGEAVFLCYPKYIRSVERPIMQLRQVLNVIKKYNEKEQQIWLYRGYGGDRIFNELAVALYLLEDYFQYGLYTNRQEIVETNGEGEILWDQTIQEAFALLQNGRPYYIQLQTKNTVDDEMDYFGRLHACVLTVCTKKLQDAGILELFDLEGAELTSLELDDFGDADDIKYRLERELETQYVTRKQTLLKTIYTLIDSGKAEAGEFYFSFYGTSSFHVVWEKVCAENFGDMLDKKLAGLPGGVSQAYEPERNKKLIEIIDRPVWHKKNPDLTDETADTLRPDLVCIYPFGGSGEYCFGIYDAKYYVIDFKVRENGCKVTGQPGVGDVTKQYLYEQAYEDFIAAQGYGYVQNMFLCPGEEAEPEYGCVEMEMMHASGGQRQEKIAVVKLCAGKMFEMYLAGAKIENMEEYIPAAAARHTGSRNYTERLAGYLLRNGMRKQAGVQRQRRMYPDEIKREPGAKLIYDILLSEMFGTVTGSGQLSELAEASLVIEKYIKVLPDPKMGDRDVMREILERILKGKSETAELVRGDGLERLAEKIAEMAAYVFI